MGRALSDEYFIERFWTLVDRRCACWLWKGSQTIKGYGVFNARLNGEKFYRAHRFSWTLHNEGIPCGLMVIHSCDNRWCVNPEHLTVATALENEHDKINKGRNCRGERVNGAKLTPAIVRMIRRGGHTDSEWGRIYGVHSTTIRNARIGKKWAHVE